MEPIHIVLIAIGFAGLVAIIYAVVSKEDVRNENDIPTRPHRKPPPVMNSTRRVMEPKKVYDVDTVDDDSSDELELDDSYEPVDSPVESAVDPRPINNFIDNQESYQSVTNDSHIDTTNRFSKSNGSSSDYSASSSSYDSGVSSYSSGDSGGGGGSFD